MSFQMIFVIMTCIPLLLSLSLSLSFLDTRSFPTCALMLMSARLTWLHARISALTRLVVIGVSVGKDINSALTDIAAMTWTNVLMGL